MEQNKVPTPAIIKSSFDLEAGKANYQKLLGHLASITVTKDNVSDDLTKEGRAILKMLADKKDAESKMPLEWHKEIMKVYKDLHDPLKAEIDRILLQKKNISLKMQEEARVQAKEQLRVSNAKQAIIDFVNKIANLIHAAITDDDVVVIEKMIGSEKTKSSVYQEFLPDLIEQCDGLRPQIKNQKENIRSLQKLDEQEKKALEAGNVIEATEIKEQKEYYGQVIRETSVRIHEKAYEQATNIDVVVPEIIDVSPKGRTNWKWRVDDLKLLQKKMPHLVKLVPDEEAIELLLKTKRNDGSLDGKMEDNVFGLVFYNDKSFTR